MRDHYWSDLNTVGRLARDFLYENGVGGYGYHAISSAYRSPRGIICVNLQVKGNRNVWSRFHIHIRSWSTDQRLPCFVITFRMDSNGCLLSIDLIYSCLLPDDLIIPDSNMTHFKWVSSDNPCCGIKSDKIRRVCQCYIGLSTSAERPGDTGRIVHEILTDRVS